MTGLLDAPGRYRRTGVSVTGGGEVHHIGPPAGRVPGLMADLLGWLGGTQEHPLIASSVFHYEFTARQRTSAETNDDTCIMFLSSIVASFFSAFISWCILSV